MKPKAEPECARSTTAIQLRSYRSLDTLLQRLSERLGLRRTKKIQCCYLKTDGPRNRAGGSAVRELRSGGSLHSRMALGPQEDGLRVGADCCSVSATLDPRTICPRLGEARYESTLRRTTAIASPQACCGSAIELHTAKELEFPCVAVGGLGALGQYGESIEDSIRLTYVAITRATHEVLMTYSRVSPLIER